MCKIYLTSPKSLIISSEFSSLKYKNNWVIFQLYPSNHKNIILLENKKVIPYLNIFEVLL